jgi:hypothetical protein
MVAQNSKKQKVFSKKSESGEVQAINVISNKQGGGSVNLAGALGELRYFENIRDKGIRASVAYTDSGNTEIKGGGGGGQLTSRGRKNESSGNNRSILDELPIVGEEKTMFKMVDNNDQELTFTMFIKDVKPIAETTQKNGVFLTFQSKEMFLNDNGETRVRGKHTGKISDIIKKIITGDTHLQSEKDVSEWTDTMNDYVVWGNNRKPFAFIDLLQKKAIPKEATPGTSAGFFLWETSEGFQFKSIENLVQQEPVKRYIFNESQDKRGKDVPSQYDGKVLELTGPSNIDVQKKKDIGGYAGRLITFDPFDCKYEVIEQPRDETTGKLSEYAGDELPKFNDELKTNYTRTSYFCVDRGVAYAEVEKSKEINFRPERAVSQATMRYNQLFTIQKTITIPGDFSLHAGDAIFLDIPEVSDKDVQVPNKEVGGIYIISELCHYMTPKHCLTKLHLVRDSYGRRKAPKSTPKPV